MRKRYKIAPTNKTPLSMGEIERMINEIWYEYPGYDAAQKKEKGSGAKMDEVTEWEQLVSATGIASIERTQDIAGTLETDAP